MALTGYSLRNLWLAWGSEEWPSTVGEVMAADLERDRDRDGTITYRAAIVYRYSVAGRDHVAERVFFGDRVQLSWAGPAARRVLRYRPGTRVSVRYDPANPARAVLEVGARWEAYLAVLMGAVFLVLGLVLLQDYWLPWWPGTAA